MIKADEIRDLNEKEIKQRIEDEEEQLQQLRFQHTVASLENPMVLRQKRRFIARLKTILKEKEQVGELSA